MVLESQEGSARCGMFAALYYENQFRQRIREHHGYMAI